MRLETKVRARALQMLYAWELRGCRSIDGLLNRDLLACLDGVGCGGRAKDRARAVSERTEYLDREIEAVVEGWRISRIGVVEKNILRLALFELTETDAPAKVVIDESVRLAHWFAGDKAPGFVNGVLDALARRHGCL